MKKLIIVVSLYLLCFVLPCNALNNDFNLHNFTHYYTYNDSMDDFEFIPLTKTQYKVVSKDEKQYYKKMKRLYKYLLKNKFQNAIQEDTNFLPAYYTAYKFARNKSDYKNALYYWQNVLRIDQKTQIFTDSYKQWSFECELF